MAARDAFTAALTIHRESGNRFGMLSALERLAGLAARAGRTEQAARQFGAVAALRETIGWGTTPFERSDAEAEIAALRARLPRNVFAAAWAGGEATTLEQALEHANAACASAPPVVDST